jgi:hypothetical protein
MYYLRNRLKNLAGIFHLLIRSRLLQTSITLFNSSLLARIHKNGVLQTPLELPQNVMYHVVFVRRTFQAGIRRLEELNDQRRQKLEKTVESTNFILCSRKTWSLLWKLGIDSNTTASSLAYQITANDIASRLQQVSKGPMD